MAAAVPCNRPSRGVTSSPAARAPSPESLRMKRPSPAPTSSTSEPSSSTSSASTSISVRSGRICWPMMDEALLARARALAEAGGRRLLGITGAPGAGKATLAAAVVDALGERAVLVPMDGFHLANAELERLGRRERKGAVDTFDERGD